MSDSSPLVGTADHRCTALENSASYAQQLWATSVDCSYSVDTTALDEVKYKDVFGYVRSATVRFTMVYRTDHATIHATLPRFDLGLAHGP